MSVYENVWSAAKTLSHMWENTSEPARRSFAWISKFVSIKSKGGRNCCVVGLLTASITFGSRAVKGRMIAQGMTLSVPSSYPKIVCMDRTMVKGLTERQWLPALLAGIQVTLCHIQQVCTTEHLLRCLYRALAMLLVVDSRPTYCSQLLVSTY